MGHLQQVQNNILAYLNYLNNKKKSNGTNNHNYVAQEKIS